MQACLKKITIVVMFFTKCASLLSNPKFLSRNKSQLRSITFSSKHDISFEFSPEDESDFEKPQYLPSSIHKKMHRENLPSDTLYIIDGTAMLFNGDDYMN